MENLFKFNSNRSPSSSTNRVSPSITKSTSRSTSQQITTNNKVTAIKKTRRRRIRRTRTRSDFVELYVSFA
jgi:hypothetical protein